MMTITRWDEKCIQYELPFFVSYCIYLILMISRTSFLGQNITEREYKLVLLVCLLLLFAKEYADRQFNPLLIMAVFLIAAMFLIIHKDASFTKAFFLAYLFCGRDVSFERIARVTVIVSSFMLLLIIASSQMGLITNYIMDPGSDREREFIGFYYALYPAAYLTNIISLEIYLKKEKIRLFELILFFMISYWVYVKTNSRLSFLMTAAVILLGMILKIMTYLAKTRSYRFNPVKGAAYLLTSMSFIICCIGSLWMQIAYNPSSAWMNKLNDILTGRLYYGHESFAQYGISMLGQSIAWVGNGLDTTGEKMTGDYLYVDCSYLQVLQQYGILFFLLMMVLLTLTVAVCCYYRRYVLVLLLVSIAVHMMIDDLILHLWYNAFWFVTAQIILNHKVWKENTE